MFHVGDFVVVTANYGSPEGHIGTIRAITASDNGVETVYAVEFPTWHAGHECDGYVPSGHGWWVTSEYLLYADSTRAFSQTELEVGTRVTCVRPVDSYPVVGKQGVIISVGTRNYGVNFDAPVNGHDCGGRTPMGHGLYVPKMGVVVAGIGARVYGDLDVQRITHKVRDICNEGGLWDRMVVCCVYPHGRMSDEHTQRYTEHFRQLFNLPGDVSAKTVWCTVNASYAELAAACDCTYRAIRCGETMYAAIVYEKRGISNV